MATSVSTHLINSDTEHKNGPIDTVIMLNGAERAALASLLYNLDKITGDLAVAPNYMEALYDIRKSAFGY